MTSCLGTRTVQSILIYLKSISKFPCRSSLLQSITNSDWISLALVVALFAAFLTRGWGLGHVFKGVEGWEPAGSKFSKSLLSAKESEGLDPKWWEFSSSGHALCQFMWNECGVLLKVVVTGKEVCDRTDSFAMQIYIPQHQLFLFF